MPKHGLDRLYEQSAEDVIVTERPSGVMFSDGDFDDERVITAVRSRVGLVDKEFDGVDDFKLDDATDPLKADFAEPIDLKAAPANERQAPVSGVHEAIDYNLENDIQDLADFYEFICGAPQEGPGMEAAHRLFIESLYSTRYLPLLKSISLNLDEKRGVARNGLYIAIDSFIHAMRPIKRQSEKDDVSLYEAFLEVYDEAMSGDNDFLSRIKRAKEDAIQAIKEYRPLIEDFEEARCADLAVNEYEELTEGLDLNDEFVEKLKDPDTKVVVVSLDFNSTFNLEESYPSVELVSKVQRDIHAFARAFRKKYPDKELIIPINTGRLGLYAWGVAESAFAPIPELRKVAVAESGGVVLDSGINKGAMHVAVENPREWANELDHIKNYLKDCVGNPEDMVIEPKLSMLSIKLEENGQPLLRTKDGRPVTAQWIGEHLQSYFELTDNVLDAEFSLLMKDIAVDFPQLQEYTVNAVKAYHNSENGGRLNGQKKKILTGLDEVMALIADTHQKRIEEIKARIGVVEAMYEQGALVANYNPTAGYVDIGHKDVNKFSTLMGHVCGSRNVKPDEVLYVQIGDSTTDILPINKTDKGEPNDGADKAFLVAVNNCNEKMRSAVEFRDQYGMFTRNQSILGAQALFKGLRKVLKKV